MYDVNQLMEKMAQVESGGRYDAYNPNDPSGAYGRYQILGDNIPSWAEAAGLPGVTVDQFHKSPDIQDQVAKYHFGNYLNKYGPWGALVAWNGGEGALKKLDDGSYTGAFDQVNQYAEKVLGTKPTQSTGGGIPRMNQSNQQYPSQMDILNQTLGKIPTADYGQMPDAETIMNIMRSGQSNNRAYDKEMSDKLLGLRSHLLTWYNTPQVADERVKANQKLMQLAQPYEQQQVDLANREENINQVPQIMELYKNAKNPVSEAMLAGVAKEKGIPLPTNSGQFISPLDRGKLMIGAVQGDRVFDAGRADAKFGQNIALQNRQDKLDYQKAQISIKTAELAQKKNDEGKKGLKELNDQILKTLGNPKMSDEAKQRFISNNLLTPLLNEGKLSMEEAVMMMSAAGELDPYVMNTDSYRNNVNQINANSLFLKN